MQFFIDQVADDLQAQALLFFISNAAAIGCQHQTEALIDIRVGDHIAIDDGLGLAQRRVDIAQDHHFGQIIG